MEFADAYFRQSKRIGFFLNLKDVSVRISSRVTRLSDAREA